jgi:hypothetical protein
MNQHETHFCSIRKNPFESISPEIIAAYCSWLLITNTIDTYRMLKHPLQHRKTQQKSLYATMPYLTSLSSQATNQVDAKLIQRVTSQHHLPFT